MSKLIIITKSLLLTDIEKNFLFFRLNHFSSLIKLYSLTTKNYAPTHQIFH